MDNQRLEKILEIKVDVNEAIKGIANLNKIIDEQRAYQKALKEEIKRVTETEGENSDAVIELQNAYVLSQQKVKEYQSRVAGLSKTVQNQLKIEREEVGSMTQLRAQLSNLTKAYDELSQEEREAASGQELKQKINDVTDALKDTEEATQRYYRNVGNYENAIRETLGLNSKFGQTLQKVSEATKGGITPALLRLVTALKAVGVQLLKLLANPIGLTLAAIAALLVAVSKGIKSSEGNMSRLNAITAAFQPVINGVNKAFRFLADALLTVVEWIGKVVGGFMELLEYLPLVGNLIASVNDEVEKSIKLENDRYVLSQRNRALIISNAKAERDVAKLRKDAKDKERYSEEERLRFVQKANEIEKRQMEERLSIAKENVRIMTEELRAQGKLWEENGQMVYTGTKEEKDAFAAAWAKLYDIEKEYYTKTTELQEQELTIKNEIAAERKALAEEEAKRIEAANKTREQEDKERLEKLKRYEEDYISIVQQTEDLLLEMLDEGAEKEILAENLRYERRLNEIAEEKKKYEDDFAMQVKFMEMEEAEADKHEKVLSGISSNARRAEAEARALDWENRILEAELNGEDYKALTLEMLKERLDSMHRYEDESEAEFRARQLEAQKEYNDEKFRQDKEMADKEIALQREKTKAIADVAGSLSSILEATAGDDKKRLKAAKVAALAEIAINQGLAIANAVRAVGAAVPPIPFPVNVAMIASSVTSAIAAIVPAIQAVNSVKLARGGFVSGAGTSTSDSIPAMLSNGEYVVNARATSMFPELLETINNLGLGIASPVRMETVSRQRQESDAQQSLIRVLREMPAPVVSVEEINRTNDRVKVLENLSRLNS